MASGFDPPFRIRSLRDGDSVSYLLFDPASRHSLLIHSPDPAGGDSREAQTREAMAREARAEERLVEGTPSFMRVERFGTVTFVAEPRPLVFADAYVAGTSVPAGTPWLPLRLGGKNDRVFALWGRGPVEDETPVVIGVSKFRQKVLGETGRRSVFIDVREPAEYATGHIEGAVNIPVPELPLHLQAFAGFERIYLYCGTGSRSKQASMALAEAGVLGVVRVEGGISAWNHSGYPLVVVG